MKGKIYEKPSMKFVDIRNQQNVAANCWHLDSNGKVKEWYYDYSGKGWVTFHMGGNCNSVLEGGAGGTNIDEFFNVPEDEKDKVLQDLINRAEDAKFEYNTEYISPNPPTPGQWS